MLNVTILSNRGGKWETTARYIAKEAAQCCDNFEDFCRYFNNLIKSQKKDSTGHISASFTVETGTLPVDAGGAFKRVVFLKHTPATGPERVIAIIEKQS